jgi:tryptophan-rich sensory protein
MAKGPLVKNWPALILFLILVFGGGLTIGFLTAPGAWYAGLAKPSFNPPSWLFAPVWTAL